MSTVSRDLVQEVAPTGRLRATINLGNTVLAHQDAESGVLGGVSVELAIELARRLGVEVELHPFDTAGKSFASLQAGECDIGFLAIDPKRVEDLDYTAPYVVIESTYLVPASSPLREIDDIDRDGVRIAAGRNTAYDLHLSRALRHARLVHYPSSAAAIDALLVSETDATAGGCQPLMAAAAENIGFRIMEGQFFLIQQAMALPKRQLAALGFARAFVEEMKKTGRIAPSSAQIGQSDITVADLV